jgi:hypothetical protein
MTIDNIVQRTNRYIFNIQSNFSHESDTILTDKIEMNIFSGLLCLAGELRSNKQSVEELWNCGVLTEMALKIFA